MTARNSREDDCLNARPPKPKPCPFCGSERCYPDETTIAQYAVECHECTARGPGRRAEDEAIEAWNRREPARPLRSVWIVADPGMRSTLRDICWEQEVERLGQYVNGAQAGTWSRENHTLYLDAEAARADAQARLAARKERTT